MTVAEFFVNLGVKGDGPAQKALADVQTSIKGISITAIAAKAALIGVIYGLERMTAFAGKRGMELEQFATLTGLSAQELQKWQLAAQLAGASGDEMTGAIKSVQSAMTDMLAGKGAPEGIGILGKYVGFDKNRARDTFYVLEKLREFAKSAPQDFGNQVLKSFGLSEGVIAAFRSSQFRPEAIGGGAILSDKQIARLAEVNRQWTMFWNTLKNFAYTKVSIFGPDVIRELNNALKFITSLTANLAALTKAFPDLKAVAVTAGLAIAAAFAPVTAAITGLVYLLGEVQKYRDGKESVFGAGGKLPGALNFGDKIMQSVTSGGIGKILFGEGAIEDHLKKNASPSPLPSIPYGGKDLQGKGHTSIQQNLHFQHDGKDAGKLGDSVKQATQHALRQMSSQSLWA